MGGPWTTFQECGSPAWLCLLLSLPALGAAVVALALAVGKTRGTARIVGLVAVCLGVAVLGVGALGRQMGLAKTEGALSGASIDDETKARIRAEGTKEANGCVEVGGVLGALPLLLGAAAIVVGLAAAKPEVKPSS